MNRIQKISGFAALVLILLVSFVWYLKPIDLKLFLGTWSEKFHKAALKPMALPISDLIRSRAASELNQLDLILPQYYMYDSNEIFALAKYSENCGLRPREFKNTALSKTWIWTAALCENKILPTNFFLSAPFLHPSGQSFTKLGVLNKMIPLTEQLSKTLSLSEVLQLEYNLNTINLNDLKKLSDKINFILTSDHVFLLKEQDYANQIYEVFTRQDWDQFIDQQNFKFITDKNLALKCLENFVDGCWVEKNSWSTRLIQSLSALLVLSLFGGFAAVTYFIQKNKKLKQVEDEKRKFALQMLTHELRTPAMTLTFLVENMRHDFDQLTEKSKVDFMKICSEVVRLQHMTKMSYQYLQTDQLTDDLKLNASEKNLLDYLSHVNENFAIISSAKQVNLTIDWVWFDMCIQNLIRNALNHGKAPFQFKIEVGPQQLVLSVIDHAQILINNAELFEAFKKTQSSHGLGLGLSLVQKILKALKLELQVVREPFTEFKILIPREYYAYTPS